MRPKLLLRIAAGLMGLHLAGHCMGHLGWKNATDPVQQNVIVAMNGHEFPFMGAVHSIGDYYEGYGWISAVAMVFFVCLLWILSSIPQEGRAAAAKILYLLCLCLLVQGILEFIFFFPFAASITLLTALVTFFAIPGLRSQKR